MKKAISLILLLVLLLVSAAGCTDYARTRSAGESTPLPGETETATDKTNASSKQSVNGTVSKTESTSGTVSKGKTDSSDEKYRSNGTGTNPPIQTDAATEASSSSGTQTNPSSQPPFVNGNDGIELPIDSLD